MGESRSHDSPLRILWMGTKSPWPARDGGRRVVFDSLAALKAFGVEVTLVAPVLPAELASAEAALSAVCEPRLVATPPRHLLPSIASALARRLPLAIARHRHPAVVREVGRLLRREVYDLIHVEQLQALAATEAVRLADLPVVLRAQNVESDLWRAALRRRLGSHVAHLAGRGLARWEGRSVAGADATVALTPANAARLRTLAGGSVEVVVQAVPFPSQLPPGDRLAGDPAVVLLAGGWWPNAEGAEWFLEAGWEEVLRARPTARLHAFGGIEPRRRSRGVSWHEAPAESQVAFAEGAILIVPLRTASGVRIKILEGWARGLPVVASPVAAQGLEARPGTHYLEAATPQGLAREIVRLAADPALAESLRQASRAFLGEHHAPERWAEACVALYKSCRDRRLGRDAGGSTKSSPESER